MPSIVAVGTAVPPHKFDQDDVRRLAGQLFRAASFDVAQMQAVFANTTIRERYFCVDQNWFEADHGFAEKNQTYLEKGVELAERAASDVCRTAGIPTHAVDHIFFVSSTGIATPSLDAHLFNCLRFKESILRTPIWGLGCGGGIAGIARASDWLRAYPEKTALVVCLELCGLTFIRNDLSKSNFIAASLFGDGCGALMMAGDRHVASQDPACGLSIEGTGSVTWEDSLDVMGWEIADAGLKVVFSKSIPDIVQQSARPAVMEFLEQHGLSLSDIRYFLAHPGGAKVIEAYKQALNLEERQLKSMREVLAGFGNMSSATVLFVIDHFLRSSDYRKGDRVLSTALGPGFFSEMVLARCL
jgi:alkylresorcinol/alkylpyrone synthase